MSVRVKGGCLSRLLENSDSAPVLVEFSGQEDDVVSALQRAIRDIRNLCESGSGGSLDGPEVSIKYMSDVSRIPKGAFFVVDFGETPRNLLERITQIVKNHLETAGVKSAVIDCLPPSQPLQDELGWGVIGEVPNAVILRLYPASDRGDIPAWRRAMPGAYLEALSEWILDWPRSPEDRIMAKVEPIQFEVRAEELMGLLTSNVSGSLLLARGDRSKMLRVATLFFNGLAPHAVVALAGPVLSPADTVEAVDALRAMSDRVASVSEYAFIAIEPLLRKAIWPQHTTDWMDKFGLNYDSVVQHHDQLVFDVFPYQILGLKHRTGLHERGLKVSGWAQVHELGGRRLGVVIGHADQWLPGTRAQERLIRKGRRLLAPLLPTSPP